ncbi:MAG: type II secretion system F family protein [Candidatus Omnitrophica bacterium]|nr:type II secretion system F family protein [Candidatus Omnitrophota bacterium]MBU1852059.1 type II secretion system F family protein [Candidatus Omnitrophota bacterium]
MKKIKEIISGTGQRRIGIDDIVVFTEQLSAMISAGISIIRCLTTLARQAEKPELKKILYEICLNIEGGGTFSAALAKYPKVFSSFYVNMVRAGESGGILDEILKKTAGNLSKEQDLKRKIKKAFAYPVIVLGAIVVVVTFLVIFIVPIFGKVYLKMRVALPMPTVMLMAASRITIHYWWAVLGGMVMVVFGYKKFYATDKGRSFIDRIKLDFPIFGTLNRKVAVSRFIRTLGSLLTSGVPILEALNVSREITGNRVITDIVDDITGHVKEGKTISEPLLEEKLFPPVVTQMMASGEEAGVLDIMLEKSADFLDKDIDYAVDKLVVRLEPVLTVFMAVVVCFIALAIYLPMFDLIKVASK